MARSTKRTSMVLGGLGIVFLGILIIICTAPQGGTPPESRTGAKFKPGDDHVINETDTSTVSTSTTTTTTTAPTTTTTSTTAPTTTTTTTTAPTTTTTSTSAPTTSSSSTVPSLSADTTDSATDVSSSEQTTPSTTSELTTASPTDLATDESSSDTSETTIDTASTESSTDTPEAIPESSTDTPEAIPESSTDTPEATTESSADTPEATTESSTDTPEATTESSTDTPEATTESSTDTPEANTESSTDTPEAIPESSTDTPEATTESSTDTPEATTESSTGTSEATTDLAITEAATTSSTVESTSVSATSTTTTTAATTTLPPPLPPVCETPQCKTVASNMLAMMDHYPEATPCKDFYQYACGGVMENPFLAPRDLGVIAQRIIKDRLENLTQSDPVGGYMRKFYDSCLNAVNQEAFQDWAQPIRNFFGAQKLQGAAVMEGQQFTFDLSKTLAHMMKNDFTPFFNMEPEVNREDNSLLVLNLYPALPDTRFSEDLARKVCLEEHHKDLLTVGSFDVEEAYKKFMDCVRKGEGLDARVIRMKEAVRRLGLLDHFNAPTDDNLLKTTADRTREFLKLLADALPTIPDLKRDLANKNCEQTELENIPASEKLAGAVLGLDWETLVSELLDVDIDENPEGVKKYMKDAMRRIVELFKDYDHTEADMNNILLMLWSEKLYTDFVKPVGASVGDQEYCLRTTIALMEDDAANLYLDALSQKEIKARNGQIDSIVANVRRAGEKVLLNFTAEEQPINKLNNMLQEKNVIKAKIEYTEKVELTDNFLENSLKLLANRRKVMYSRGEAAGSRPFMQPYDPFGVHIYELNQIMIPYAAQEPSSVFNNIPEYLSYAGIGHMISHLVWHGYESSGLGFDPDGRYFTLAGKQDFLSRSQHLQDQYTAMQSYVNPHGPDANFRMSLLSWHELLSDSRATHLAWEAYLIRNETVPTTGPSDPSPTFTNNAARRRRRRRSLQGRLSSTSEELPLPYLGLSPQQLYYLHWAQHHCSASSELSILEVMESRQPPARMRVNLVVQEDPFFSEAFQCSSTKESLTSSIMSGENETPSESEMVSFRQP